MAAAALIALSIAATPAQADDGGWWGGSSGPVIGAMGWQQQGDGTHILANAGRDQHVAVGATVEVDGSASLSPSGTPLSYSWAITSKPSGSHAALTAATAIRPQLTIDAPGDYVLTLTVRAGGSSSIWFGDDATTVSLSQVTLSTNNVRPVANAGRNRIAAIGSTLALDGAGSFDADGNAITYSWSLVQVPRASKAALSSKTVARPQIVLDQPGTYVAELTVTDSAGATSLPARVAVSTRPAVAGIPSAGPAQSLVPKATARIDGDGSYLPGSPPQSASWSLIAAPAGSKAALAIAPDAREALTPDVAGDYVVQMAVGGASQCGASDDFDDHHYASQTLSRLATVLVSTNPVAPVARTGPDQRVSTGALVTIDAAPSSDVTGPLLTYTWALIAAPPGSTAKLSDPSAVRPTFTADVAGPYVAQLIVSDGTRQSMPSTVMIAADTATPLAPLANAGPDPLAATGTAIPLDGRGSTDPDGATLSPQWSILGLGDQLTGSLTSPTSLQTGFAIPAAGVPLNVAVLKGPAAIAITAGGGNDDSNGDDGTSLTLASAGRLTGGTTPYTVWRVRNGTNAGKTATLASADLIFSLGISVPARSDLFVASPVIAGGAQHKLSAGGKLVATVNALSTPFTDTRLAGGDPALRLSMVELAVSNALLASFDDVAVSTVEARPLAVPHAASGVYRGVAVALDGLASKNPNTPATPTSGLTYRWALLSRPAGSTAALANATMVQASLTPDVYGLYVAQLIVSDGTLDSRPQTVAMTVTARPPIASAAAASPAPVGQVETLDGSASLDPDGNALTYAWTLTGVPTGSAAKLSNATLPKATFTSDIAGIYTAQLIVHDAYGASSPASVTVVAKSLGLQFDAVPSQSVALGSIDSFLVRAADPAGKPVSYSLTSPLPTGAAFNAGTGAVTFHPTSNIPSQVTLTFSATNGTDTATLSVPIAITGAASGATAAVAAQVLDAVDYAAGKITPVSGAVVSSNGVSAASSSAGMVTLSGLLAGVDTLTVSAASAALAPDGTHYGDGLTSATLIAGVTNTLPGPILLPRGGVGSQIVPGATTTVANPALGITLAIAPGAALNPDGTPYTGTVTLGSLPASTPMSLPPGFSPCQIFTVSPAGITFNPAAQMTVANADHLPPGSTIDLWAFDTALGSARVTGTGTVSADGTSVLLTTGGLPGGTILAFLPRRPGGLISTLQPTDTFVPSMLGAGNAQSTFSPPSSRVLNQGRGRTFLYNSATAHPRPVLRETAKFGASAGLPSTLQTSLTLDGVTQAATLTTNLSTPLPGAPPLTASVANALVQSAVADASALTTGAHSYSFLTVAKYACSAVAAQSFGAVIINNQAKSPFGPGWQLAELQALTPAADGSVAVTGGTGVVALAHPQQAPSFVPNPVYVPVSGPFRGATADLQGLGRPDLMRLGWKDGSLNVILNQGNRQFAKVPAWIVGTKGALNPDGSLSVDASDISAGDINADGITDIMLSFANENTSQVFFGAGGGTFAPFPASIGQNEVGGYNTLGDWIGTGRTHGMVSEGHGPGSADFHPVYNDGFGHLTFIGGAPNIPGDAAGMTTARFPGFAHDSFVSVTQDGSILFAYGGANQATNKLWSRGVGTDPGNVTTAAGLTLFEMIYDSAATDTMKLPGPVHPADRGRILSTGDIDGSGTPAFAVAGSAAIYIVTWTGPGAGNQKVAQTLALPSGLSPDAVTLAPLARGNRASVIATAGTAGFYVFLNDGKGNFASPVLIQTPFRAGIEITVTDFDGDGISDVALNDLDNDRVAIYFGKASPTGAFVAPIGDYTRLVQNADGSYSRLYNDGTRVNFTSAGLQTAVTDANGNTTSYTYNGAGQLTSLVDPNGATTNFTYAGAWMASMTDGAGRTTSFTHDASGNTTSITDPAGNTTQYLYDAGGQLIATIDPKGAKTANTYTATGQLNGQTYPDGTSVALDVSKALGLDALGVTLGGPANAAFVPEEQRLSFIQDAKGNFTESEVNAWGAVVRVVDVVGRTSAYARDLANRVIESVIPAGISTGPVAPTAAGTPQIGSSDTLVNDYQWDANGNLLVLEEGAGHAPHRYTNSVIDRITTWTYEPTHYRVASKTDAAGFTTSYTYDANGNQLSMTDAAGNVTAYAYDQRGLRLSATDPLSHTTTYVYDANGNKTRTTDAAGTNFDVYYDSAGNEILSIDATGSAIERRRSARYDGLNRKVAETGATGESSSYIYDANSNLAVITDPAGNVTTRAYDSLNRLLTEVRPDTGSITWTYDANSNPATLTDASGAVSTALYDAANRRVSLTDATGAVQTLAYDLRDNLAGYTDSNGQTTAFEYDALNRLNFRYLPGLSQQPGGGGSYATGYDARDNAVSIASPVGVTNMTYDALSRLVTDGFRTRTYDAAGNTASVIDRGTLNTQAYTFDALNRIATLGYSSPVFGNYQTPVTLTYGYDALSRRTSIADSLGGTTAYAYDAEDRVASITSPWGGTITQSYDSAGRPLRLAYPNGLDADLTFEAGTGRIATITHRAGTGATPIASFAHTYDVRGNLASLTESAATKTYGYDALDRLTSVMAAAGGAAAVPAEGYTYDGEGNRKSAQSAGAAALAVTVDAQNRVTGDGVNTYTWSAANALLTRTPKATGSGTTTFTSSWQGAYNQTRLDQTFGPSGAVSFLYDAENRLVGYRPHADGSDIDDRYYDGTGMVLQFRRPPPVPGTTQWARYVYAPGIDRPLAFELYPTGAAAVPGTGQVFYYHADAEGSIRLLTDANGAVANRYDYDSFGKPLNAVEAVSQPYTWKGREYIAGIAQYYNRARFYDPQLGRFTSEDPFGYRGAGGPNLTQFARANPRRFNDPRGLDLGVYAGTAVVVLNTAQLATAVGAQASCLIGTTASALALINKGDAITSIDTRIGACSVNGQRLQTIGEKIDLYQTNANTLSVVYSIGEILVGTVNVVLAVAETAAFVKDQIVQRINSEKIIYIPDFTNPTQIIDWRK